MLVKNLDEHLVNGTVGRVMRFCRDVADDAIIKNEENFFPVVLFNIHGGLQKEAMVARESFTAELPNGEVQVRRTQVRFTPTNLMIYS